MGEGRVWRQRRDRRFRTASETSSGAFEMGMKERGHVKREIHGRGAAPPFAALMGHVHLISAIISALPPSSLYTLVV